jgi:putative transposase
MRSARFSQLELGLPSTWGGRRAGAGRKRQPGLSRVAHRARAEHCGRHPVHVTLRSKLKCLRTGFVFPTVRLAIASLRQRCPADFRVVHFSVQQNHLHFLVEGANKQALSSGLRSLVIRLARRINRLLMRRGPVWADRWHGHELSSPRAVRNALVYVLGNFRKHADVPSLSRDPFSSAAAFTGFREPNEGPRPETISHRALAPPPVSDESNSSCDAFDLHPVSRSRTWLLATGWKRHGLIGFHERPRA